MSSIESNLRDDQYPFVLNTVTSDSEPSLHVPLLVFRERVRAGKIGRRNYSRDLLHLTLLPLRE